MRSHTIDPLNSRYWRIWWSTGGASDTDHSSLWEISPLWGGMNHI